MAVTYRTDDFTRWGAGQGSNLAAAQIDVNFWTLFSSILALQDHAGDDPRAIDHMTVTGNQLTVTLRDNTVLGPYTIPTAKWTPRGQWLPATSYSSMDLIIDAGAAYQVIFNHVSAGTFDPSATDGFGHDLYALILPAPSDQIPANGVAGQALVKSTGSPGATQWADRTEKIALFVKGQPLASELLLRYEVAEDITLPIGLAGSKASAGTQTNTNVSYDMFKNGISIGSVDFLGPSPDSVSFNFTAAVSFVPGDILTVVAPAAPDSVQADVSFTFVATIGL